LSTPNNRKYRGRTRHQARLHSSGQSEVRSPKSLLRLPLPMATCTPLQTTSPHFTSRHSFSVPQRCDAHNNTAADLYLSLSLRDKACIGRETPSTANTDAPSLIDLSTLRLQDYHCIAGTMHIAGIPKASVEIHVNGSALHEHPAESELPMTATSYVETVGGAEFSVVLNLERHFTHFTLRDKQQVLVCAVSLDGQEVLRRMFRSEHLRKGTTHCMDNAPDEMECFRKFTFAQHASSKYITRSTMRD
jgi:aspartyl/asparaginyl-tRNA synthetase